MLAATTHASAGSPRAATFSAPTVVTGKEQFCDTASVVSSRSLPPGGTATPRSGVVMSAAMADAAYAAAAAASSKSAAALSPSIATKASPQAHASRVELEDSSNHVLLDRAAALASLSSLSGAVRPQDTTTMTGRLASIAPVVVEQPSSCSDESSWDFDASSNSGSASGSHTSSASRSASASSHQRECAPAVVATQRGIVAKFYSVGCCSRRCTTHVPQEDLLRRRLLAIQMTDGARDFFVLGQLLTSHIIEDPKKHSRSASTTSSGRTRVRARRERNVFRYSADHTICRDLFLMMNATGVKRYRTLLGRLKAREALPVESVVTKRKATSLTRRTKQKRGRTEYAGVPRPVKKAFSDSLEGSMVTPVPAAALAVPAAGLQGHVATPLERALAAGHLPYNLLGASTPFAPAPASQMQLYQQAMQLGQMSQLGGMNSTATAPVAAPPSMNPGLNLFNFGQAPSNNNFGQLMQLQQAAARFALQQQLLGGGANGAAGLSLDNTGGLPALQVGSAGMSSGMGSVSQALDTAVASFGGF